MTLPVLSGLRSLAPRYDGYLLDLWGTLHDGEAPLPGALDCLARLKARGKRIVLLSNAPRRVDSVIARLDRIGLPRRLYDHVMTSGEVTNRELRRAGGEDGAAGRHFLHLGPDRDDSVLDGIRERRVDAVEAADFVLNTGPLRVRDRVADYEGVLAAAAARGLPMVCANPDRVVLHRGRRELCAGALALRYEELGGRVRYYGKPYPEVYEACLALLGAPAKRRVLAIGDSLATDVAGAHRAGIDSVFITSGVHADELGAPPGGTPEPARVEAACAGIGALPVAILTALAW